MKMPDPTLQVLNLGTRKSHTITHSDLNRPYFAWHPYGKAGLFKTELVIVDYCI